MNRFRVDTDITLLIIDVQERLLTAIPEEPRNKLLRNIRTLAQLCADFGGEVRYSEQYPKGLGDTDASLLPYLEDADYVEKTCFDYCGTGSPKIETLSKTILLCGVETHICVLATALSLIEKGHQVWVPLDTVASRTKANYKNGLQLMQEAGVRLVNTETIVFQTLVDAKSDRFKTYSKRVL